MKKVQDEWEWEWDQMVKGIDWDDIYDNRDVKGHDDWDWDVKVEKPKKVAHKKVPKVKTDHGYKGICGHNFGVPAGQTFWCDDREENLRTHCVVVSAQEYKCCADTDGCYEQDDMKTWRLHH